MSVKTANKQDNGTTSKKKFVVTRSGIRVSDIEYETVAEAANEVSFWKKIISRWPDGTKINVEEYDDKKHKVY
jgi:hypothetical protein